MEAALESLKNTADLSKVGPALNLLKVYFDNIAKEPSNPKYRKIRVANAKFNATIWQLEEARTFLLLAGFEQKGEFLSLPDNINIDTAKLLVESYIGANQNVPYQHPPTHSDNKPSQGSSKDNTTLKLAPTKGSSYFDQEVKANLTLLSYMVEMGFDKHSAEQALIATKNAGVQPAMDWLSTNSHLIQHMDTTSTSTATSPSNVTSHSNVSSSIMGLSTSDSKPAPASRYQKTADERHKFQEKLRLEAIEAARAEKIAKQQHKQYLLKEMQSEKEEKKEKNEMSKKLKTLAETSEGLCSTQSTEGREVTDPTAGSSIEKTELKIRLPDGQITDLSLANDAPIKEIYRHITRLNQMNEDDFVILTMYPQTELTDMTMTVQMAGLTPRANLVVQRLDQHGMVTEGHGQVCTVKTIISMDDWQSFSSNTSDKLLVVEFFTSWCANCRSIADQFESLNAEYGINQAVLFARVDIDQLKVLKYQMQISTLPTFKLYWNDQEIATHEGNNMAELEESIKKNRQGPDETQSTDQDPR